MHHAIRVIQACGAEGGAALVDLAAHHVTVQALGHDQRGAETAERVDDPVPGCGVALDDMSGHGLRGTGRTTGRHSRSAPVIPPLRITNGHSRFFFSWSDPTWTAAAHVPVPTYAHPGGRPGTRSQPGRKGRLLLASPGVGSKFPTFRWAEILTGSWALLYVIICLDPAVHNKIETARSLVKPLSEVQGIGPRDKRD
jgi:hypothetical protein